MLSLKDKEDLGVLSDSDEEGDDHEVDGVGEAYLGGLSLRLIDLGRAKDCLTGALTTEAEDGDIEEDDDGRGISSSPGTRGVGVEGFSRRGDLNQVSCDMDTAEKRRRVFVGAYCNKEFCCPTMVAGHPWAYQVGGVGSVPCAYSSTVPPYV